MTTIRRYNKQRVTKKNDDDDVQAINTAYFSHASPGFASLNIKQPNAKISSSSPAAAAISSLNLLDVKTLAEEENWRCVYTNQQHSVVSFSDKRAGETISVNVFYDQAVVGIWFHHPRMGKTQSFRQVDLSDLRKIFRDPRVHTGDGYSNIKKQKKKFQKQVYYSYIGDRVHVKGYEDAVIVGEPKWPGDLAKIRFTNGEVYRVETSHLILIDRPHLGCKSLYAEAEMQLERLNNELDRIMTEKMRCEKIIQHQRFGGPSSLAASIHDVNNMNMNLSPKRDNVVSLKKATPSPRAVVGAFVEPGKLSPSQPNKLSPSPRAVSAFEPYKDSIKSSSGVSMRSVEWDDAQFSIAPFFPANH